MYFEFNKKLKYFVKKYKDEIVSMDEDSFWNYGETDNIDRLIIYTSEYEITIFYSDKIIVCSAYKKATNKTVWLDTIEKLEELAFKKGK